MQEVLICLAGAAVVCGGYWIAGRYERQADLLQQSANAIRDLVMEQAQVQEQLRLRGIDLQAPTAEGEP